jgi:hypothetical protein
VGKSIDVHEEDSFDLEHLPRPGEEIKQVFSLRLDTKTVALIDRARDAYAKKVAAAVGRATVPRESRSAMIRLLIEDGLGSMLGLHPSVARQKATRQKAGGR